MWTYGGDPNPTGTAAQKRDAVRFLAQENQSGSQRVSDEEIAMLIATEMNIYVAAAVVAEAVANRMGPVSSKSVDDLSISYSRADYLALASRLRARGSGYQIPTAGGISIAEKATTAADADIPVDAVRRGQHDNPGTQSLRDRRDDLD